jgi:hypothetical protein
MKKLFAILINWSTIGFFGMVFVLWVGLYVILDYNDNIYWIGVVFFYILMSLIALNLLYWLYDIVRGLFSKIKDSIDEEGNV